MKFTARGILLIIIAVVISYHQFSMGYPLFQWEDVHHETFILVFAFTGIVVTLIARGRL